jgi:uroporphyrinogen-III decarboxylase
MTPRQRVLSIYAGKKPDQVPLLLDLSHWCKANYKVFFDLTGFKGVDQKLVELHKELGVVSYIEMSSYFDLYTDELASSDSAWTDADGVYHRKIVTPQGTLEEERVFAKVSYSYNIRKHLLETIEDFEVICYIMDRYKARPRWDRYQMWRDALGELSVVYCVMPYSGLGYLISRNFGVENTCMAMFDHPEETKKIIDSINACNLRILDTIIDGPFEVLLVNDNFDSNVQNPNMFNEYSRSYYTEVARRLHAKGKYLAVHVDGEMKGCLQNFAQCGVDCIDAATPAPMFALTPAQARAEAGDNMILSGGIPANIFGPTATDEEFENCVRQWLETRHTSFKLFMAAGDQVPPDASWERISKLPVLVEKYGKY